MGTCHVLRSSMPLAITSSYLLPDGVACHRLCRQDLLEPSGQVGDKLVCPLAERIRRKVARSVWSVTSRASNSATHSVSLVLRLSGENGV